MLTVRSRGEPFVGKFNARPTIDHDRIADGRSDVFSAQSGTEPIIDAPIAADSALHALSPRAAGCAGDRHDRTELPPIDRWPISTIDFDVSARFEQLDRHAVMMVPNTLGDLTKRENRFAHYGVC